MILEKTPFLGSSPGSSDAATAMSQLTPVTHPSHRPPCTDLVCWGRHLHLLSQISENENRESNPNGPGFALLFLFFFSSSLFVPLATTPVLGKLPNANTRDIRDIDKVGQNGEAREKPQRAIPIRTTEACRVQMVAGGNRNGVDGEKRGTYSHSRNHPRVVCRSGPGQQTHTTLARGLSSPEWI